LIVGKQDLAHKEDTLKPYAILLCAVLALMSFAVKADEGNQVLTLQVENDLFFGSDKDFTNGIRLSYVARPGNSSFGDGVNKRLRRLSPLARSAKESDLYYSLSLGQNMYTPADISSFDLITGDRPYAGWLYLGFGVTTETKKDYEILKLDVGIVGPASLAGAIQRWWHRAVIDAPPPNGWEHQLPNELGINLYYTRGYKSEPFMKVGKLQADFTPHWGAALGNVYTYGAGGFTVRLGFGLERAIGAPPRIQPSLPGSAHFSGKGISGYLFFGAEGRAVLRNIFLDGTWRDHEHSVDSKTMVGELQAGGVLFMGPVRLALTNTFRTEEFIGAVTGHRYSALTMSVRF